jgi:hypothetical protein
MATITVWNKGKRSWDVKNAEGKPAKLNPQESLEMDEAEGRRLCMNYPKDLSTSGIAGPSSSDLARQEQSLRDRTANLDKREAAIKAREDALGTIPPGVSTDDARADLVKEAEALGLKIDGRMGIVKIKAMIDEAKAAQ